ncbi:MAG TPA: hypothetical protein VN043_03160 [Rhodanobacter sp.]|nr:hypothetical protein [Rhodanobacter sp.]
MRNKTFPRARHLCLLLIAACSVTASMVMVHANTLPTSTPVAPSPRNPAAMQADALFWQTLHNGDYARIQPALEAETGAHLRDPGDSTTTAHVGFLHIWRLSERARQGAVAPTVTDDAVLARNYFQRAVNQAPGDARYQGFLASAMLAEAGIQHDPVLQRQAERTMQEAIKAWPAFNLFTAGYVMSSLDAASPGFQQALAWQWSNLDVCARGPVDRLHPDIVRLTARIDALPADARDRRACNETAIASHNQEGFFLNMGDMLVKSGNWQTARTIYAAAKSTPGYASWPFRHELEQRIADAPANVARFNAAVPPGSKPPARMMLGSSFACMACHQQ